MLVTAIKGKDRWDEKQHMVLRWIQTQDLHFGTKPQYMVSSTKRAIQRPKQSIFNILGQLPKLLNYNKIPLLRTDLIMLIPSCNPGINCVCTILDCTSQVLLQMQHFHCIAQLSSTQLDFESSNSKSCG